MLVVSRQRQPLIILHPKKRQSVMLMHGEAINIPDFYAELPVFKNLVDKEVIATSGVAEKAKEFSIDIPDDVKADLEKYKIAYSDGTDRSFLEGRLRARREEYQFIAENLKSKKVKLTGKEDIDTLIELQNKVTNDDSKAQDMGTKTEQKKAKKRTTRTRKSSE